MKPIFLARGPAFKGNGYKVEKKFETKDIYAIIAHVVGIVPRKTNASLSLVSELFAPSSASRCVPSGSFVLLLAMAQTIIVVRHIVDCLFVSF